MQKELLYSYFANKANEVETAQVIQWVNESEENKQAFLAERKIWDLLLLIDEKADEGALMPYKAPIISIAKSSEKAASRKWPLIAAASVFFIFSSIWAYKTLVPGKQQIAETINTIEVPGGQQIRLTLPDHSVVVLNSKSKFSYPTNFDAKFREVQLEGEGYFDIRHQPERPFTVVTPTHRVQVLGTVFNINAYPESKQFEATLVSGSVKIDHPGNVLASALLTPDQKYSYHKTRKDFAITEVNTEDYTSWKDGIYHFNNIAFEEMVMRLQNYYKDIEIEVKDAKLLKYKCTGKFRQEESLEDILEIVSYDLPLKYTMNKQEKKLTIYSKN